ncbi:MFS transporter [Nocardiopsis oceani]
MYTAADTGPKAGVREWIGLAVLALPVFILALDMTALHLALPHLAADLNPTSTQQLWILDIYGFLIAGFLITMGGLGDRIGRRRLLMIGGVAFAVASVLAAYSTTPEMLIATRALLGMAGATLMPSTLSLIRNLFLDARQRAIAIAVWTSCFMGGTAIGPLIGGALLEWFWWGSVFLMALPAMLLLLVVGPFVLPEYKAPAPGRFDLVSVLLSLLAILPFVFSFKEAAKDGWGLLPVAALAIGLAFGWMFVRRQRTLQSPLVDLKLFRSRAFSVGLSVLLIGALVQGAFILLIAQYLQIAQGQSPLQAGLWMLPHATAGVVSLMVTPVLAARLGSARTLAAGLVLCAAGYLLFAQIQADSGLLFGVSAGVLVMLGSGPLMVLVTTLVISAAPKVKSGTAASLSETCSEMGLALGVATLGAVGTAMYRSSVSGAIPDDVPQGAADTARDSFPGAASAVEGLPAGTADALMDSAREAFAAGVTVVGYVSALIALVLAVLTLLYLKNGPATGAGDEGVEADEENRQDGSAAREECPSD